MSAAEPTNLAFACPCGATKIRCKGLCARCYELKRLSDRKFGGQREAAVVRDGKRCVLCRRGQKILVHHREPGVNDPEAFITLCRRCHPRIHSLARLPYGMTALFITLWTEQHGPSQQLELPFTAPAPPPEQLSFAAVA